MADFNTIYIGNKPPMRYVMALITAFNVEAVDFAVIKARGRAISRAVDVAEIARSRYLRHVKTKDIQIGTEQLPSQHGGMRGVSTIAITLERIDAKEPGAPKAGAETVEIVAPVAPPSLSEIKGVGPATEEKLLKAGFTTVDSVARATAEKLSKGAGMSEKTAAKLIESAKELLG
jgi:DNA-binding protein